MDNTWQKIDTKKAELKDLYTRMDNSAGLAYLNQYKLLNFDGKPLDKVINVTNNKAAVFAHTVISDLLKSERQTVVEGAISSNDAHRVEQFIDDALKQGDEYLQNSYGIIGLYEWLCNHICIRGPVGAEWFSWIEDDEYKVHCLPVDMRYTPFQSGQNGLEWVAPILFQTEEELELQFPELKGTFQGTGMREVRDYWDTEANEVWVDKKLVKSAPNPFRKPPFVIEFPPAGFMLRDKGYIQHEGEDIFFLMRGLNEEINRTLSIEQSLIFAVLRPPMEVEVKAPTGKPPVPAPLPGEFLEVPAGERHIPVPTGDFNRANLTARQDLLRMLDEGAPIAPRAYSTPPSGAQLQIELEALQRTYSPRVIGLTTFLERFYRLIVEQFIQIAQGKDFTLGKIGNKRIYSAARLKDPSQYSITCKIMTSNKRQELANLAMFTAAYGRLPLRYNLENVLMAEDPDGIIREMEIEDARKADPAINLFEMARRYAQQANEVEDEEEGNALKIQSMMLTERGVFIINQRNQPVPELPPEAKIPEKKEVGGGGNLLPLIGEGLPPTGVKPEPVEARPEGEPEGGY